MNTRDGYKTKLADKVGYTVQMVSMLLDGRANASFGKSDEISRALKGGGTMVWMDPKLAHKRKEIFNRYKENLK